MPGDESRLNGMDRLFVRTSGWALVALGLLFNGAALLLGIVGLVACKHPFARKRALDLTLLGGFITLLGVGALIALSFLAAQ